MATQAEIDALKGKMDIAYSALQTAKGSMDSYYAWLLRCKYKDEIPSLGEPWGGTCQSKLSCNNDCCSKSQCESVASQYNASVLNWETADNNYESAKDAYETAKGEVSENQTDKDIAGIEEEAKTIRTRYYVIGGIIIIAIILFVWIRYIKK